MDLIIFIGAIVLAFIGGAVCIVAYSDGYANGYVAGINHMLEEAEGEQ